MEAVGLADRYLQRINSVMNQKTLGVIFKFPTLRTSNMDILVAVESTGGREC
jgi:hypothetical protein